jgi:uncharacterized delta-60 repeat protein
VTTAIGSGVDAAHAVAVQPDGKIVAVGSAGSDADPFVVRYSSNGSLDTSFGSGGKATIPSSLVGQGSFNAVSLQPDGKIVAAGTSFSGAKGQDFVVARYNANGSLDASFGTSGIATTDVLGHNDVVTGLALQPDGTIVAGGKANTGSAWDFAAVRYAANGALDTSFGTNGKVTTSFGSGDSVANALVRQPDGKLVLAGYSGSATSSEFALVRYTAGGSLDPTFGSSGKVTTALGSGSSRNEARALALQPDGKIIAAGYSDFNAALARYEANGTPDTAFAADGYTVGVEGTANAVAVQPDGRIVTAGQGLSTDRSNSDFALARYDQDGSQDESFGPDGTGQITTGFFGSGEDGANAIALQPDGKIVAAGTASENPNKYDFALARYLGVSLSIAAVGNGTGTVTSSPAGINCGPTCAAPFADVPVTLTATASARSAFAGWSGDCTGKGTCTLTMSTDRSVVATFVDLCVVPKVKGKKLKDARRTIAHAHCSVGKVGRAFSARVKQGRVISQKPRPGKKLREHSKVALTVSKGRR